MNRYLVELLCSLCQVLKQFYGSQQNKKNLKNVKEVNSYAFFLLRTLQCFKKEIIFFRQQKVKKTPSKVAQKYSFFLPWAAKMAYKEELTFEFITLKLAQINECIL